MILQRIIGLRGSGKTYTALAQAFANSPVNLRSLYICRSMNDAERCYKNFLDRWRGATFKRCEIEWQTREVTGNRHLRFASQSTFDPVGSNVGDITLDLPLADVSVRWLEHVMVHAQGTLTVIAGEPWSRDMRAWRQFRLHCGEYFKNRMLLTTCHAPGQVTQAKVPLIIGQRKPFHRSIWLPGTPEVLEYADSDKFVPQARQNPLKQHPAQNYGGFSQ